MIVHDLFPNSLEWENQSEYNFSLEFFLSWQDQTFSVYQPSRMYKNYYVQQEVITWYLLIHAYAFFIWMSGAMTSWQSHSYNSPCCRQCKCRCRHNWDACHAASPAFEMTRQSVYVYVISIYTIPQQKHCLIRLILARLFAVLPLNFSHVIGTCKEKNYSQSLVPDQLVLKRISDR